MPQGDIVFDTTCVFHLAHAGYDYLLAGRYADHCYLPDEVAGELQRGGTGNGFNYARVLNATWWRPLAIEEPEDQQLFHQLLRRWGRAERNRGEAAAIILAQRHSLIAVLDDRVARSTAKHLGIRHVGTVSILARCVADGTLTLAGAWEAHTLLVADGFRSPVRDRAMFCQIVEAIHAASFTVVPG